MLESTTEQEFLDFVNATPKENIYAHVDLAMLDRPEMLVGDFIALCEESLREIDEPLRECAVVVIDDDNIEFRACRVETSDEHIDRCRVEFDRKRLLKENRRRLYEQLKQEFGDA